MKTIRNSKTGHVYQLLRTARETNGDILEMVVIYPPHSAEPPAHFHPCQTECFKVLSGEITLRMDKKLRMLKTGETFEVPPKTVHSMWNASEKPTTMHWVVTPALETEQLFATLAGLANHGQTDEKGVPNLLQIAVTMSRFSNEFRAVNPPFWIQKVLFLLLRPIALLLGYKPVYPSSL